jgi:hypothetical protein
MNDAKRISRTSSLSVLLTLIALGCEPGMPRQVELADGAELGISGEYEETGYEEWQGAVGLKIGNKRCSATLIHPRVVITAAHCVWNQTSSPQNIVVFGGADPSSHEDFASGEEVVVHPGFNPNVVNAANVDIAMVELESDVTQAEPYPVRQDPAPEVGDTGVLVGYGYTADGDTGSWGVHRAGETEVLALAHECLELGGAAGFCRGDSGGPFFTEQKEQWVLTGVSSWTLYVNACFPTFGNYSVNLVQHRDWIAGTYESMTGEPLPDVEEIDTDTGAQDDAGVGGEGEGDSGCATAPAPLTSRSLLGVLLRSALD